MVGNRIQILRIKYMEMETYEKKNKETTPQCSFFHQKITFFMTQKYHFSHFNFLLLKTVFSDFFQGICNKNDDNNGNSSRD